MNWYLRVRVESGVPWPTKETVVKFRERELTLCPETAQLAPTVLLAYERGRLTDDQALQFVRHFLTSLSWAEGRPIRDLESVGGSHPIRIGKGGGAGVVSPNFRADYLPDPADSKAKLALALYREAHSANSVAYGFLGFFKILNVRFPNGTPQITAVRLALQCGARIASQLLSLTWPDLDLERGRLRLSAKDAKNHRELWVPVADALVARLRTMQATSTSALIFPAPLGGVLHHFQDHFRQAVKAAGLDSTVTPHALRHTWASRFAETSGDLLLLQRAGNWSSLKMVKRYAHVREGRDAEVMRQMEVTRAAWARQAEVPTKTPRPISRAPRNA